MQSQSLKSIGSPTRQKGAALIVGLVLLLVLTVLGVSGINMASLELQMTGNTQAAQLAFQAAETGIDVALSGPVDTATPYGPFTIEVDDAYGDPLYEYVFTITCAATTPVPEGIYSEGGGARAIHFDAVSTGNGPRNAVSVHTQSVYIIGPDPSNPNYNPAVSPQAC